MPKKCSDAEPVLFSKSKLNNSGLNSKNYFLEMCKLAWSKIRSTSSTKGISATTRGNALEIQTRTTCKIRNMHYKPKLFIGQYTLLPAAVSQDQDIEDAMLTLKELANIHYELYKYFNPTFRNNNFNVNILGIPKVKLGAELEHNLMELAKDDSFIAVNTIHIYVKAIIEEILDYSKPTTKAEFLAKINQDKTINITSQMLKTIIPSVKLLQNREDMIYLHMLAKRNKLAKTNNIINTSKANSVLEEAYDIDQLGELDNLFTGLDEDVTSLASGKHQLKEPNLNPGTSSTKKIKPNLPA